MAERKLILITGEPGVGKTSLVQRIYWDYKARGVNIGGILTREARENKARAGFRIMDLKTGREGWLARTNIGSGPRIGRYTVHVEDLDSVGTSALESAMEDDSVRLVLVDEIGPMEMTSTRFREALGRLFERTSKPVVATFKLGSNYPVLESVLKERSTVKFEVKIDNRDALVREVTARLDRWLVGPGSA